MGDTVLSGGLVALLDDVAALAKLAAASIDDIGAAAGKAGTKAMGVVVDDAAVTPRYVDGFSATRELPVIWRIAVGSLRNKILFILPAALLLSQVLPWMLTPLLMLGGVYLSCEGAGKVLDILSGRRGEPHALPAAAPGADHEDAMVRGAIATDFILSAEIMVIALGEVADQPLVPRAVVLVLVALGITALVYGAVALIVKMDDIGLGLAGRSNALPRGIGRLLVSGMPVVMKALSAAGIAAMLWVGGHILIDGSARLGWPLLMGLAHRAADAARAVPALGGFLGWSVDTLVSALVGLAAGGIAAAALRLVPRRQRKAGTH